MRQETVINNTSYIYRVGDKMKKCYNYRAERIECVVSEISPSGKYLKVDICDKWYKAVDLHQRTRTKIWQNSTYLTYIGE